MDFLGFFDVPIPFMSNACRRIRFLAFFQLFEQEFLKKGHFSRFLGHLCLSRWGFFMRYFLAMLGHFQVF
jgi:hypothetical protein